MLEKVGLCKTNGQMLWCSPKLVDVDGDGLPEIICGDEDGVLYAFRGNRQIMWAYEMPTKSPIQCPPAVGDIDNDGRLEIVVSQGDRYIREMPGRITLLRLGVGGRYPLYVNSFAPGDRVEGANGVPDSVNEPVLYDINGDGKLEILVSGFDYCLRAFDQNLEPIWKLDYDQENNDNKAFYAGDTMWCAPTLAVVDGRIVILQPVDVGKDMTVGFIQVPYSAKKGGALLALNADGTVRLDPWDSFMQPRWVDKGTRWHQPDHICKVNPPVVLQTSPLVADVNGDGEYEVVLGTGQAFENLEARRVTCYSLKTGDLLWQTDQRLEGHVFMSPVCAPLGNRSRGKTIPPMAVIFRTLSTFYPELYAVDGRTGEILSGFPTVIPFANNTTEYEVNGRALGVSVADLDGDGQNEIVVPAFRNFVVFDCWGNVKQTIGLDRPEKHNDWIHAEAFAVPAIGDLDGDGRVEVAFPSRHGLEIFRGGPVGSIPWPQYGLNQYNNRVVELPPDSVREFVRRYYLRVLRREPEPGGWEFWSQHIKGGLSEDAFIRGLVDSREFGNLQPSVWAEAVKRAEYVFSDDPVGHIGEVVAYIRAEVYSIQERSE